MVSSGSSTAKSVLSCKENITSNSGLRSSARGWRISSTSRSNGIRWWANASRQVCRTAATASPNPSASGSRVRSTSVLAKKPISSSASGWCLPATGVPTATSSWPVIRASTTLKAASSTMNRVAERSAARASSRATSAASSVSSRRPPAIRRALPRGRSTGRASGVTPESAPRQCATRSRIGSPVSDSSCQAT